jgi:hypothetical protein
VIGLDAPLALMFPGDEVTVYPVTAEPPSEAGAVKLTVACAFPAVAVAPVGAPGAVGGEPGVTEFDTVDAALGPAAFVATTVNV